MKKYYTLRNYSIRTNKAVKIFILLYNNPIYY